MILLKIEIRQAPDIQVSIGLKFQYKEFNYVEDAMAWIFANAPQIKHYTLFNAEEFSSRPKDSRCQAFEGNGTVHLNSTFTSGKFE